MGDDRRRVDEGDGGVLGPKPGPGRVGADGHSAPEGDQLGQLRLVPNLRTGPGKVDAATRPPGQRKIRDVRHLGQTQGLTHGERMPGRQDRDPPLRQQLLTVEPGQGFERRLHQRHISTTVAQQQLLFADTARPQLDLSGIGLSRIGIEKLPQQFLRRGGLERQHQTITRATRMIGTTGTTSTPRGSGHRIQSSTTLMQQNLPGPGQRNTATVAIQQHDTETPLKLLNRPGQRRLSDTQPLCGTAEMQLLGNRHEVPQLASLQRVHAQSIPAGDTPQVSPDA